MIDLLFPLCRVSCSRFVDQYGPVPAWPVSFFIHLFTAVRCRAVQCAAMERLSRRGRALRPLAEYGSRPSSYAASRVVRVELQNNAQASRRDFFAGDTTGQYIGGDGDAGLLGNADRPGAAWAGCGTWERTQSEIASVQHSAPPLAWLPLDGGLGLEESPLL